MAHDDLTTLKDTELIAELKQRLTDERALQAEFLAYLGEVDRRRLYAGLGYSSLFVYCVDALGLSKGSTYKRIRVARMEQQHPTIYELIRNQKISLAALVELAPLVEDPSFSTYLISACGKSKRDVEQLVACVLPKPDVSDCVRKLPSLSQKITSPGASSLTNNHSRDSGPLPQPPISNEPFNSSLDVGGGGGMQGSQNPDFHVAPSAPISHRDQLQPLSENRVKISFTCSAEFRKKLEQIKSLLWHKYPDGKLEDILEQALDVLLQQVSPELKFRPQRKSQSTVPHSRYIPKHVKNLVWQRDQGRCQFVGHDGHRCNAQRGLEFDHVEPWALGGPSNDPDNVRLLCHTHNHFCAVQTFGETHG